MNRKIFSSICALFILTLSACNNSNNPSKTVPTSVLSNTSQSSASTSSQIKPTSDEDVISYLNDDEFIKTNQELEGVNEIRATDEEDQQYLERKTKPLEIGESFTETFDYDFSDDRTRIFIDAVEKGAQCSIINGSSPYSIDGSKCLYLTSDGDFAGVNLSGLKYSSNATYLFEYDFRIIEQSNGFFIQLRSNSAGYDADAYVELIGETNIVYHQSAFLDLKSYSDYHLSIFPRNYAGSIVIDNIKITRQYSKPRISMGIITPRDESHPYDRGSILEFNYEFFDPNKLFGEKSSDYYWFSSLSKDGLNKKLLKSNSPKITIPQTEEGKYIGVCIRPTSNMPATCDNYERQSVGFEYTFYAEKTVENKEPSMSLNHSFDVNSVLIEDFERDLPYESNIYFQETNNAAAYISDKQNVSIDGNSLHLVSNSTHGGIDTKGYILNANTKFLVSFDYKFLKKTDVFYVQFRTSTDMTKDIFTHIEMPYIEENRVYHFSREFSLGNFDNYYLQLFAGNSSCDVVIDNLTIAKISDTNETNSLHLTKGKLSNEGDYVFETFGDQSNPIFNLISYNESYISQADSIDISSLRFIAYNNETIYLNLSNQYKSIFGVGLYEFSFDYKVISHSDSRFFVSFVSTELSWIGSTEREITDLSVGNIKHFSRAINFDENISAIQFNTWYTTDSYTPTIIIIDNLKVERLHIEKNELSDLENVGDTVLETFGDFNNQLITVTDPFYAHNISASKSIDGCSFIFKAYENAIYYLNLPKNLINSGVYKVEFDYLVNQADSRAFFGVYDGDELIEKEFENLSVSEQIKHFEYQINVTNSIEIIRILTFYAMQNDVTEIIIDNLRITKISNESRNVYPQELVNYGDYFLETFDNSVNNNQILKPTPTSIYGSLGYTYSDVLDGRCLSIGANQIDGEYKKYSGVLLSGETNWPVRCETGYYQIEFDYCLLSNFAGNIYLKASFSKKDISLPIILGSSSLNTKKTFQGIISGSDYIYKMSIFADGANEYQLLIDNFKMTRIEGCDEETIKPASLTNVGDYFLESFNPMLDEKDKIFVPSPANSAETCIEKNNNLDGYCAHFATTKKDDSYVNYSGVTLAGSSTWKWQVPTTSGTYRISFDYFINEIGSCTLFLKLSVKNGDISLPINKTTGQKMTFIQDVLVTDEFYKMSIFGDNPVFIDMFVDNVKFEKIGGDEAQLNISKDLVNTGDYIFENFNTAYDYHSKVNENVFRTYTPTKSEPQYTVNFENYIGDGYVLHYESNENAVIYEGIYLKPKTSSMVSNGKFTLSFYYATYEIGDVGTMYIAVYDDSISSGNKCSSEPQIGINSDVGIFKHFSLTFETTASVKFVRIMSSKAGRANFVLDNFRIEKID